MALIPTGKLEKLKILGYTTDENDDIDLKRPPIIFEAMYNPTTFNVSHESGYVAARTLNQLKDNQTFTGTSSDTFSLNLLLDATGASYTGGSIIGNAAVALAKAVRDVGVLVQQFLETAYDPVGEQHKPRKLVVVWGRFIRTCVLSSVSIDYKLFDPNGIPLRAELTANFKESVSPEFIALKFKFGSPDLTHSRLIKAGDTLPNMMDATYKDSGLYLEVAKANNLKNFRRLKVGQQLVLPPVEKISTI